MHTTSNQTSKIVVYIQHWFYDIGNTKYIPSGER